MRGEEERAICELGHESGHESGRECRVQGHMESLPPVVSNSILTTGIWTQTSNHHYALFHCSHKKIAESTTFAPSRVAGGLARSSHSIFSTSTHTFGQERGVYSVQRQKFGQERGVYSVQRQKWLKERVH